MKTWNRRQAGKILAAAAATSLTALIPRPRLSAAVKARVVVIGGGAGGATAAKYIAQSAPALQVTLVEAQPRYTTPFFSNLFLAGLRSHNSITHGYDALKEKYGINVVFDRANDIDPIAKKVTLAKGDVLSYDRLVVAPGVAYKTDTIDGYDRQAAAVMPHAWSGGEQLVLLKRQIEAMADGGTVIIAPPKRPYRCPPAPYERAAMIANYLKQHKPRAKILIIDSKNQFSMQELFLNGWDRFYEDMIEWLPADINGGGTKAVDARNMTLSTEDETFEADVINLIPPQEAGVIAQSTGLTDATGWCPVDPKTLSSRLQPDIHVLGDAIDSGALPKAAHAANQQAKICAGAILSALTGRPSGDRKFNNTCWDFISSGHAIRVGGLYEAGAGGFEEISGFVSEIGEDDETRAATAKMAQAWYQAIVMDMFG